MLGFSIRRKYLKYVRDQRTRGEPYLTFLFWLPANAILEAMLAGAFERGGPIHDFVKSSGFKDGETGVYAPEEKPMGSVPACFDGVPASGLPLKGGAEL